MMLCSKVIVCLENTLPSALSPLCFSRLFFGKQIKLYRLTRSWSLTVIAPQKQMEVLISVCQLPP